MVGDLVIVWVGGEMTMNDDDHAVIDDVVSHQLVSFLQSLSLSIFLP